MARFFAGLLGLVFLAASPEGAAYGGSLHKIWGLDLSKTVEGPAASKASGIPILALRFSPDGQQIAAAVTRYAPGGGYQSNLILVRARNPNENIKKFTVQGVPDDYGSSSLPALTWSPASDAVTAGRTIIRLRDGKTCEVASEYGSGFIGADRVLVIAPFVDHQKFSEGTEPTRFDVFDDECQIRDSWEAERKLSVDDLSTDRGLLYAHVVPRLFEGDGIWPTSEIVIDIARKSTIRSSPASDGTIRFANHGKAICAGKLNRAVFSDGRKLPVRCFDVDTGTMIAEARNLNVGAPIFASEGSSRIVAHDIVSVRIPFSGGESGTMLRRRVVWDFETNKEIASWGPSTQSYTLYRKIGSPLRMQAPFRVAISPDGRYVAEGGNGVLRLYEIVP